MGVGLLNVSVEAWNWDDVPGSDLLGPEQWERIIRMASLSSRESEVCQLLFLGQTRNEIAERLGIKSRTVRQYVEQLHCKLRVSNRVGLVLRVIQMRDRLGDI